MAELGVGLININIARHSKVGHFADQSLGQENVSGGQVPVDDLAETNNIICWVTVGKEELVQPWTY